MAMWDREWLETLVANVPGAIYRCAMSSDWAMEFMSDGIEPITGYPAVVTAFETEVQPVGPRALTGSR
jgi:hypothetical protein